MTDTDRTKSKKKILVIEDDEDIRNLILFNLSLDEEFELLDTDNGEEGLVIAEKNIPDLIILDIMLPGIDGFEVCRILKENISTRRIPVIMLTARADDEDVIRGYELGVEDYLRKPFNSMKILSARIHNVLQRRAENSKIKIGSLEIDPLSFSVTADGIPAELSYSEFKILQLLAENRGVAFSREAIMANVKAGKGNGEGHEDKAGKKNTLRSVDVQVLSLRKKLGSCGHLIGTVRGAGYIIKTDI